MPSLERLSWLKPILELIAVSISIAGLYFQAYGVYKDLCPADSQIELNFRAGQEKVQSQIVKVLNDSRCTVVNRNNPTNYELTRIEYRKGSSDDEKVANYVVRRLVTFGLVANAVPSVYLPDGINIRVHLGKSVESIDTQSWLLNILLLSVGLIGLVGLVFSVRSWRRAT